MLKLQDFKDKGYRIYKCREASPSEAEWANWLVQKKISDSKGIKYCINVYICDMRLWGIYEQTKALHTMVKKRTLHIQVQMTRHSLTYDFSVSNDKEYTCPEDIEMIVEEMWQNLDMDYKEKS